MSDFRSSLEKESSSNEKFHPAFNAPVLHGNIHLDYKSRDAEGNLFTPEATLKSTVFVGTDSGRITVARGASRPQGTLPPVHGASGMAGVGKTTALIGLGHDEDVQAHFNDGVLYMSIGASATVGHVTTELWKMMRVTGATTSAAAVKSSKSLADAIAIATEWLREKRILFLIDDIWPTSTSPEGYLPDLRELLKESPESRMVVSTRSRQIAGKDGSHVDFGARNSCGQTALAMFLAHALPDTAPCARLLQSARSVLLLCAGLLIALAVAGAAVNRRMDHGSEFEEACREYANDIETQICMHPGTSFLDIAIRQSLTALEKDWEDNEEKPLEATENSLSDLYISLSV